MYVHTVYTDIHLHINKESHYVSPATNWPLSRVYPAAGPKLLGYAPATPNGTKRKKRDGYLQNTQKYISRLFGISVKLH